MTTTVDRLYQATERVKAGDLSYRISLPARDQLSALGEAFDNMTASVQRLLRESEEKSRLESELEIAREVQARLFPQNLPQIPGLELYGVCKPARMVSGDYYDFLRFGENRVGLVLGDISGKGISAALLMASIQSALHAQFYDGHSAAGLAHAVPLSAAGVVRRLNRQLFESTPREKYATFFYGVYDGENRKLTYTNAGHLPPFFFHGGKVERLGTGGTVIGLFGDVSYEEAMVELEPGDTLLAFTDGVTEPENIYGEEFGEGRLLEVVRRALNAPAEVLVEEVCRSVGDWTGQPDLQDDMTVVVARALG
jgi:phosphoserine phosphatase RsbU/P